MGNPYHFLFTIHIFLHPTHNTSPTSSNPTHSHFSIPHPPQRLYAVGIAVRCNLSRGGLQPRLFLLLDFRPSKIQPSPAYPSCIPSLSNRPKLPSQSHSVILSRLSYKNCTQADTESHSEEKKRLGLSAFIL